MVGYVPEQMFRDEARDVMHEKLKAKRKRMPSGVKETLEQKKKRMADDRGAVGAEAGARAPADATGNFGISRRCWFGRG